MFKNLFKAKSARDTSQERKTVQKESTSATKDAHAELEAQLKKLLEKRDTSKTD